MSPKKSSPLFFLGRINGGEQFEESGQLATVGRVNKDTHTRFVLKEDRWWKEEEPQSAKCYKIQIKYK